MHVIYKILPVSTLLLALCACQDTITDTSYKAANTVEDNASLTWNKARDILDLRRNPPPMPPTPRSQSRYCYNFFEDIVCYAQPIPGEENRLIAYQGNTGQTGYVLPAAKYKDAKDSSAPATEKPADTTPLPPPISNSSKLKEIFFDPAELEPKELVPPKPE